MKDISPLEMGIAFINSINGISLDWSALKDKKGTYTMIFLKVDKKKSDNHKVVLVMKGADKHTNFYQGKVAVGFRRHR